VISWHETLNEILFLPGASLCCSELVLAPAAPAFKLSAAVGEA